MLLFFILAAIGFCIAAYAYWLDRKIKYQPNYKPVCDINDFVSCTKPIKSSYSNIFFVSNALVGMSFYGVVISLALLNATKLLFIASLGACIASFFLAYLLFFKIKSLCLLCTSLYLINAVLLWMSIKELF